ncbi:MAG TPA: cysteine synthase family protein [Fimbriimonas sp.]|nr:cysteine synthase family protein [Fimbriimonas sp.]
MGRTEEGHLNPAIGTTPLVRLQRIVLPSLAEVWVKVEGQNPTGSMKDRMGQAIVLGAIARGDLKPGGTMMDYTGGSTGSSIAMVCASLGYRSHFVSSNAFDESKLDTMRAFGAQLDVIHAPGRVITPELFRQCFERRDELAKRSGYVWADQFSNPDNKSAYHAMAREILVQLGGAPDGFVAGVGTGGCFSGNAEVLSEANPGGSFVAVEPENSRPLAGLAPTGGHRLEGMGVGYVTPLMRTDLVTQADCVSDERAAAMARKLAREEGLFAGLSSGANVVSALRLASKLGPNARVVTVLCDSGLRYVGSGLFRDQ